MLLSFGRIIIMVLGEAAGDLAEFLINRACQRSHARNCSQSNNQADQCVLDQVLTGFFPK